MLRNDHVAIWRDASCGQHVQSMFLTMARSNSTSFEYLCCNSSIDLSSVIITLLTMPHHSLAMTMNFLTSWYIFHRSKRWLDHHPEGAASRWPYVTVWIEAEKGRSSICCGNRVPPLGTIARLHWGQLDETSYCATELYWGSNGTIDLKLILDVCCRIHNS